MIGIYKIVNKLNGKLYIGQSINITDRWYQHKFKAFTPSELGYTSVIHQAFRKYGIENFNFEIIEECLTIDLDDRERYWIKELNTLCPDGYNIQSGGQRYRKPQNPKSKQKTQNSKQYFCKKCGVEISTNSNFCVDCGQKSMRVVERPSALELAQLVKEKGFESVGIQYGVTGNTIKKWCKSYNIPHLKKDLVAWYHSQVDDDPIIVIKKLPYKTPVHQLDMETRKIIQTFESACSAARSLGKAKGNHITEVCQGKLKQAYGYFWQYA